MKIFFGILLLSVSAFAAKPIYKVSYEYLERGQVVHASQIILEQGKSGEVNNDNEAAGDSFSATVKAAGKKLAIDYRIKIKKGERSIEIAKTGVPIVSKVGEVTSLEDSSGDHFQLKVMVVQQ